MRLIVYLLLPLTVFLSCVNHGKNRIPVKISGEAQGTYWVVTYYDDQGRDLTGEIDSLLKAFDNSVSIWVPNSIISRINGNDTTVSVDEWFKGNFLLSKEVFQNTDGAFDPTVGQLVNVWGFGIKSRLDPDSTMIDSLLQITGFDKVKLAGDKIVKDDPRIEFDFNAVAQGYSVDLTGELLESYGITDYLIDIGGEVLAHGTKPGGKPWKVGIQKPEDNAPYGEDLTAIVFLENKALATSGSYRKFYEKNGVRYSHTINPKTGYPVQHSLLSVSVLASGCATADAYATAFMVMGTQKTIDFISKRDDLDAFLIYSTALDTLKTWYSKGFDSILQK